jgi:hypothetical protein
MTYEELCDSDKSSLRQLFLIDLILAKGLKKDKELEKVKTGIRAFVTHSTDLIPDIEKLRIITNARKNGVL